MSCWLYEKEELRETPSIKDGIALKTERRYRQEGARFIMNCGGKMELGHITIATGVTYFHRFYMLQSFKQYPRYITACSCLFLAGKSEETPKKIADVIEVARLILPEIYFRSFGENPQEEVLTTESIMLQTLKFDVGVEHPHTFVLKYANRIIGDKCKLQKVVQMAWNFVNDSLTTVLCLQWEPEIIAIALLHLACKLSKFCVTDWNGHQKAQKFWWDMFVANMEMDILEDICHQVLDIYQKNEEKSAESSSLPQKLPPRTNNSSTSEVSNTPYSSTVVKPVPFTPSQMNSPYSCPMYVPFGASAAAPPPAPPPLPALSIPIHVSQPLDGSIPPPPLPPLGLFGVGGVPHPAVPPLSSTYPSNNSFDAAYPLMSSDHRSRHVTPSLRPPPSFTYSPQQSSNAVHPPLFSSHRPYYGGPLPAPPSSSTYSSNPSPQQPLPGPWDFPPRTSN